MTIEGGGTVTLETVTVTPALGTLGWPKVSVATAVKVCEPLAVVVVFQT